MQALKPLPDELADTAGNDNSCSFCGVSYLILHDVERLQQRIAELEAENLSLQRIKNTAQTSQLNTLSSMDALSNLTEAFKTRADEATQERDQILKKAKKLEDRNDILIKCIQRLQKGLGVLRDDVTTLREAVQSLKSVDATVIPGMMDTLYNLITNLEDAYREQIETANMEERRLKLCFTAAQDDLTAIKASMEKEIAALKGALANLTGRNEALEVEVQELRETIALLQATNKILEDKIATMTAEINTLKTELHTRIGQCNSMNSSEKEHVKRIELLTLELQQKNGELADLLTQLAYSKADTEALRGHLANLEQALANLQSVYDKETGSYRDTIADLNSRLSETLERFGVLERDTQAKHAALQKELADVKAALTAEKAESAAANQMCDKLKMEQKELLRTCKTLSEELESLRNAYKVSKQSTSAVEEEMQKTLKQLRQDNKKLEDQVIEFEDRLTKMRKEKDQKEQFICNLDMKLQDAKVRIADLEKQLAEKTQQLAQAQADSSSKELLDEARKHIAELEAKIHTLQQTIFKECQERSNLLHTLTTLKAQNAELAALRDRPATSLQPQPTGAQKPASNPAPSQGNRPGMGQQRFKR